MDYKSLRPLEVEAIVRRARDKIESLDKEVDNHGAEFRSKFPNESDYWCEAAVSQRIIINGLQGEKRGIKFLLNMLT